MKLSELDCSKCTNLTHLPDKLPNLIELDCSDCTSIIFAPRRCIVLIGSEIVEKNYQKYCKEMCHERFGKNSDFYEELIRVACRPDRLLQWTDDLEFYEQMF
jgi:hypothetical protein